MTSNPKLFLDLITRWAACWGTPQLPDRVVVTFSTRLAKSLGRVNPKTGSIRLNERLKSSPRDFLIEVLCHEAAHVAVYILYGSRAKPHGIEWQGLIRIAGYRPTTSLIHSSLKPIIQSKTTHRRHQYRCLVCHQDFFVSHKNSRLHCPTCHEPGVSAHLQFITPQG